MNDYKNTPDGKRTAIKYADIINLNRPASSRPKMDLTQRAKIFSPYDALRGFDEAIDSANQKSGRVQKVLLSEEEKKLLSDRLLRIRKGMMVTIQYFDADPDGLGTCKTANGAVTKLDPVRKTIEIQERTPDTTGGKLEKVLPTVIRFDDLLTVDSSDITRP